MTFLSRTLFPCAIAPAGVEISVLEERHGVRLRAGRTAASAPLLQPQHELLFSSLHGLRAPGLLLTQQRPRVLLTIKNEGYSLTCGLVKWG